MIERDEIPEENARKELLEEIGCEPEKLELWKVDKREGKIEWNTYYFIAKNCRKVQETQLENGEKIKPFEVTFEEFLDYIEREEFRNKDFTSLFRKIKEDQKKLEKFKKIIFE